MQSVAKVNPGQVGAVPVVRSGDAATPVSASVYEAAGLPVLFRDWFARRGWRLRAHQAAMVEAAAATGMRC